MFAGQRGDRGGVDPAGEKCADGNVSPHVFGDRIPHRRGDVVVQHSHVGFRLDETGRKLG